MDPLAAVVENIKGFAKSTQNTVHRFFNQLQNPNRRKPIEILKRLQREAFSDLMKLRDRQDKVERIVSYYKTSEFQENVTRVTGAVDVLGAIVLMGSNIDRIELAGARPGVYSRFTFETTIREKDTLVAELVANQWGDGHRCSPFLSKLSYTSDVDNWFSVFAVPIGARCRDIDITSSNQRKSPTEYSMFGPPLLNLQNDIAFGLRVRKSNIVASISQFIAHLEPEPHLSTFGQIMCQLSKGVKLSIMGLQQKPVRFSNRFEQDILAIPVSLIGHTQNQDTISEPSEDFAPTNYIAVKMDSDIDEYTKLGGWIEMKNSNPKHLQWGLNLSDNSEEEFGWGISVGGMIDSAKRRNQFRVDSYLKINLAKRFSLKPGLTYVVSGGRKTIGFMFRSNWRI